MVHYEEIYSTNYRHIFLFSEDSNVLYEQAQKYENQGNYKRQSFIQKLHHQISQKRTKYILEEVKWEHKS